MLPVIEGVIARRVLLNFRADPAVVAALIPKPLEVATQKGFAVVGICLIRLEKLRPKGLPALVGISSENMAHRVAIKFPGKDGPQDGVYIWRRETDLGLVAALGGRFFPGVHSLAKFNVRESPSRLDMNVISNDGTTNVALKLVLNAVWKPTPLFETFDDVCAFFAKGDCGFSCSLSGAELEGMQLRTLKWKMSPLTVESVHSAYFENQTWFPAGSLEFECAVLMRGIPHEWHELTAVPELAGKSANASP